MENEMTIEKVTGDKNFSMKKSSWARGYISRKTEGKIEPYTGRYGNGYKIHRPTYRSTQYHIVEYYIGK